MISGHTKTNSKAVKLVSEAFQVMRILSITNLGKYEDVSTHLISSNEMLGKSLLNTVQHYPLTRVFLASIIYN